MRVALPHAPIMHHINVWVHNVLCGTAISMCVSPNSKVATSSWASPMTISVWHVAGCCKVHVQSLQVPPGLEGGR
eukprot:12544958-Alexandrium_andersonii.AAC.1